MINNQFFPVQLLIKFLLSASLPFLLLFPGKTVNAGQVDLLLLPDFEALRPCIDLSPDIGILENYRRVLTSANDLENLRSLFESIGVQLLRNSGKPVVTIEGCECNLIDCDYIY